MEDELSAQNQLNIHLLARVAAIEGILMVAMNSNPRREEVMAAARLLSVANEVVGLSTTASDEELALASAARQKTFDAVFYALPQATDSSS